MARTTAEIEADLVAAVAGAGSAHFAAHFERDTDGRRWRHGVGVYADPSVRYISSSTAKPAMIAAILWACREHGVSLRTRARDVIPGWTASATGAQIDVELWHCLQLTSGISSDVSPASWDTPTWATYLERVAALPAENVMRVPGVEHIYSTVHLDVATAIVTIACGYASWIAVFNAWRSAVGLFTGATWITTPQVSRTFSAARELDIQTGEYLEFLRAIRDGHVLTPPLALEVATDEPQRIYDLFEAESLPPEDWRWSWGLWRESRSAVPEEWVTRIASVGLAGQYGVIDREHGYRLVCTRRPTGESPTTLTGVLWARQHEALIHEWAEAV